MPDSRQTIGSLARSAGVNVETVRYYHRRGLLPIPKRGPGSVRRYGADSLRRLSFIRRAQRLGFSLDEVQALLGLNDGQTCARARAIAAHKLSDVEARLRDLRAMRKELGALVRRCEFARGRMSCPLIEALGAES